MYLTSVLHIHGSLEAQDTHSTQITAASVELDLGLRVDLRLVLDQYLRDWHVVFLGGEVHRSQAVLGSTVAIGSSVQQQRNHVSVTLLGRQVQRREAVLSAYISIITSYISIITVSNSSLQAE